MCGSEVVVGVMFGVGAVCGCVWRCVMALSVLCMWPVVVAYVCWSCEWFLLFSAMCSVVIKMPAVCCSSSGVVCVCVRLCVLGVFADIVRANT